MLSIIFPFPTKGDVLQTRFLCLRLRANIGLNPNDEIEVDSRDDGNNNPRACLQWTSASTVFGLSEGR
jgi:hypothetical protein